MIRELQEESGRRYVSPFEIALIYVGIGDRDRAFEWLDKAYRRMLGPAGLSQCRPSSRFHPLRWPVQESHDQGQPSFGPLIVGACPVSGPFFKRMLLHERNDQDPKNQISRNKQGDCSDHASCQDSDIHWIKSFADIRIQQLSVAHLGMKAYA